MMLKMCQTYCTGPCWGAHGAPQTSSRLGRRIFLPIPHPTQCLQRRSLGTCSVLLWTFYTATL